jgi:hypothetical protein
MYVLVVLMTLFGLAISSRGKAQQAVGPVTNPALTRADFLQMLDRPRVPLAAEVIALPGTEGLVYEHFTYAAEKTQRVPGILL